MAVFTNGGVVEGVATSCDTGTFSNAVITNGNAISNIVGSKAGQICIILAVVMLLLTLFVVN